MPKLPDNYGTLDAQASIVFRVEFREDATLGKISQILSTRISNLDALAREAVEKITFTPKMVDGEPTSVHKMVQYRYSWEFGWRITRPKSQKYCPKATKLSTKPKQSVTKGKRFETKRRKCLTKAEKFELKPEKFRSKPEKPESKAEKFESKCERDEFIGENYRGTVQKPEF